MDRLPVELIERVCSFVCPHCQSPDDFPDADTQTSRVAKAALSGLSRTSRRIATVVQPYLFHYFASGGMTRFAIFDATGRVAPLPSSPPSSEKDPLALFLRTVVQRPDLAAQVRALQLAPLKTCNEQSVQDSEGALVDPRCIETPVEVRRAASLELGGLTEEVFSPGFAWDVHGAELHNRAIYHALEQLAMVWCSNVRTLIIGDEQPSSSFWRIIASRRWSFPSLKTVGLLSHSHDRPFTRIQDVLESAPNVETLYVTHLARAGQPRAASPWVSGWTRALPSVRRLVTSDLRATDLAALIRACPQLRDLEFRHHGFNTPVGQVRGRELAEALRPAQKTLRRLLVSVMAYADPWGDMSASGTIDTLRDFEVLEELAINQFQVPGASSVLARFPALDPMEFLPRSIKRVEFLNMWSDFNPGVEGLMQHAPTKLPNLRSIRFNYREPGHWEYMDLRFREVDDECNRLRALFGAISVSFVWDRIPNSPRKEEGISGEESLPGSEGFLVTPYCFWEA
jgi:hypothetical protein